jgi:FkbM family methyltransferase
MYIFHIVKVLIEKIKTEFDFEKKRLSRLPRYIKTSSTFLGKPIEIVDACTYLVGLEEIFRKENYRFVSDNKTPLIIDVGANIGLSVIYFKLLFPHSRIIAFEPDPEIFNSLQKNIKSFELQDVKLYNRAASIENGEQEFVIEGGYSGHIKNEFDAGRKISKVPTTRLQDVLFERVDFLKIDVEGAETEIIKDCADMLKNVHSLFIEYHSHEKNKQTLDVILNILTRAGFRYHIKEAYTVPHPYIERPCLANMDLQLEIFAIRQ